MILVAGGSGMLGIALQNLYKKHQIAYKAFAKRGLVNCAPYDLSQPLSVESLFQMNKFDYVVHAAAMSDVDGCELDPEKAYTSNALTTKNLSKACAKSNTPFIYVSTDYVFDGKKTTPYEIDDRTGPVNIYGMTKLAGEYFVDKKNNPKSIVVRTSWLFGSGNEKNFVDVILNKMKNENYVEVLKDQTDSPTYTSDLALAIKSIGEKLLGSSENLPKVLHFCNKGQATRYEMTKKIKEILNLSVMVDSTDTIPNRAAIRPSYGVMSTAKFEELFDFKIRSWEEGLKDYLLKEKTTSCAS